MPAVNPEILKWARETAGLSLEEAAQAIKLNNARGKTGAERLADLEEGAEEPSRALLKRMADKYRRSLLVFYLSKPPHIGDRGQDFRKLPQPDTTYSGLLDALIRDLNARQSLVKSLLEDEETEPISYIGSASTKQGVEAVAASIIKTFAFDLKTFREQKTYGDAFAYIRELAEENGIYVLLIGNLGSHHSVIPVEIFRGFAIADPIAPFVVINDQDARAAWSFTLLHEVAHLWLGETGVSGKSFELEIEQFCNSVAGAILLPSTELVELPDIQNISIEDATQQVTEFAAARKISRSMVAYKLLLENRIERTRWHTLSNQFEQEWLNQKQRKREDRGTSGKSGGPNYYVVRRHRLGEGLIGLVNRSMNEGGLTPTKAAKILDVKPRNVEHLLNVGSRGGSA